MERSVDAGDAFHAHLDVCEQCRNHPFKLCHAGSALLREAASAIADAAAEEKQVATEPPALDEEGFPF